MDDFDEAQKNLDELASAFNMYTVTAKQIALILKDVIAKMDAFPVNEFATVLGSFEPATEADRIADNVCSDWLASLDSNGVLSEYAKGNLHAAQLAERDAEIAALRAELDEANRRYYELSADMPTLHAKMGELNSKILELMEWKEAVPVASVKRLLRDAPDDDVSEWIKFAEQ